MVNNVTQTMRDALHAIFNEESVSTKFIETRSNKLRAWYNKGQQAFRQTVTDPDRILNQLSVLNDTLETFEDDVQREGFLMGWQSDAYAYEHGLGFSVLGGVREEYSDVQFAWQD